MLFTHFKTQTPNAVQSARSLQVFSAQTFGQICTSTSTTIQMGAVVDGENAVAVVVNAGALATGVSRPPSPAPPRTCLPTS